MVGPVSSGWLWGSGEQNGCGGAEGGEFVWRIEGGNMGGMLKSKEGEVGLKAEGRRVQ